MSLVKQKISNHNEFAEVEREVSIVGFSADDENKRIQIFAKLSYERNGKDVTKMLKSDLPDWVISNDYSVVVRDENLQPVQNPKWKEENDEENKYLTCPAYDYFVDLVFNKGLNIKIALQSYVILDDERGAFNL